MRYCRGFPATLIAAPTTSDSPERGTLSTLRSLAAWTLSFTLCSRDRGAETQQEAIPPSGYHIPGKSRHPSYARSLQRVHPRTHPQSLQPCRGTGNPDHLRPPISGHDRLLRTVLEQGVERPSFVSWIPLEVPWRIRWQHGQQPTPPSGWVVTGGARDQSKLIQGLIISENCFRPTIPPECGKGVSKS